MPSSYAPDSNWLLDQLAKDNDELSKENKRLNQIVDAFCVLAGADPSELPTLKAKLDEALSQSLQPVRIKFVEHSSEPPF